MTLEEYTESLYKLDIEDLVDVLDITTFDILEAFEDLVEEAYYEQYSLNFDKDFNDA